MTATINKQSDITITYIGGGSRGWAWTFMTDLALDPSMSGVIRLYDIDLEAAKANEQIGNSINKRPEALGKWTYETCTSLQEALTGTDFVVISILPGTFDEMASDVHTPEAYGIYQSVGDTAGPGGMIRALRTLPMFVTIAEAIRSYSPKAWVINYTNPMSLCVKTLYHVFPEIKAFGCCHEVFGTQKVLQDMLKETMDIDAAREDIHVNVLGINHFTWFDYASYKSYDLFPLYRSFIEQHYQNGFYKGEEHWANSSFTSANRVKFDLFNRFGLIAAAGDRHLAEFMPSNEYLKDPETVKSWKFGLTTVDWRKEDLLKRREKSLRLRSGEEQVELKSSGEEGVLLIKALCGLTRVISNVNIPNTAGQIGNLDKHALVETNAVFERDAIRPVYAGNLPSDIKDLIDPHVKNHELILEAALNYDKDKVVKAFENDPLVTGKNLTQQEIQELVDTMIKNTLTYLPKEWASK